MTTIHVILVLAAITALGLGTIVADLLRLIQDRNFGIEYFDKFHELVGAYAKGEFNDESYRWLTYNSVKMQRHLGSLGVVSYKPAASRYMMHGFQPIVNIIPEIRSGKALRDELMMVDDLLVRHAGVMDEAVEDRKKDLYNPIRWFGEGVQWILLLPLSILKWLGIIGNSVVTGVAGSAIFKLVAFIVALIGLIGSVVTIALGWDQFVEMVQSYMPLN